MAGRTKQDPTDQQGKPQSDYAKNYGAWRKGDSWFSEEQNDMDNRKTDKTPDGKDAGQAGRARKMQQDDLNQKIAGDVQAGYAKGDAARKNVPSYKKGGKVKKTGLALLHKGEKVIPKKKVKRTEKAIRKYKR